MSGLDERGGTEGELGVLGAAVFEEFVDDFVDEAIVMENVHAL